MKFFVVGGDIHIDDVSLSEYVFGGGDTMADDLVFGSAEDDFLQKVVPEIMLQIREIRDQGSLIDAGSGLDPPGTGHATSA